MTYAFSACSFFGRIDSSRGCDIYAARQVYAALGFTYHLKGGPGSLHKAIDYYHQALGLKSEDTFATEMLRKAFEEIAGEPL